MRSGMMLVDPDAIHTDEKHLSKNPNHPGTIHLCHRHITLTPCQGHSIRKRNKHTKVGRSESAKSDGKGAGEDIGSCSGTTEKKGTLRGLMKSPVKKKSEAKTLYPKTANPHPENRSRIGPRKLGDHAGEEPKNRLKKTAEQPPGGWGVNNASSEEPNTKLQIPRKESRYGRNQKNRLSP